MRNFSMILLSLVFLPFVILGQINIYDIQYTEVPGYDGTYPSPMEGDNVYVGGIVTATGFDGDNYFISSTSGGPWNVVNVTQTYDQWDEWKVNDGSGPCIMSNLIFSLQDVNFPIIQGYPFSSIKGVISYHWDDFRVHPRSIEDLVSGSDAYIFSIPGLTNYSQNEIEVLLNLSILGQTEQVNTYNFTMQYNPGDLQYIGFNLDETLSANGTVTDQSTTGNVNLSFSGNFSFSGIGDLIKLNFVPLISGETELEFSSAFLNGTEVDYLSEGIINVLPPNESTGDTLTTIQRPLLNIPSIVVPGEELEIICLAPESTTGWQVAIVYQDKLIELEVIQSFYHYELQRWYLNALIPQPEIYELYDLKVTASGNIEDITRDAVRIIDQFKDNYYFVQITDTHLPTHLYHDDPQYEGDSAEMENLREVIKDINLINPEFVLITGDFINEGELEDFQDRRYYTKAQRMLTEFEVPVYLVAGNHDLGGWNDTPPPQGTARNDWWRFFGWPWLIDPPATEPYYTQDYSFDYGPVHYIGLESYDNYDGYMYYVYVDESFIPPQFIWLDNDLQNSSGSESRVLFYHFDFADQINLSSLGVDMALWGHIHHNSGSIYSYPYNLATDNTCDEDRSYRIIKVDNGDLQPENTVKAGENGENVDINFFPANNGLYDSVSAVINNDHYLDFENGLVKFIMPKGEFWYSVNNGILKQVDKSGQFAVCYVKVNIPATDVKTVSIKVDTSLSVRSRGNISPVTVYQNYPNPFSSETTIRFWLGQQDKVNLEIYDISGNIIRTLLNEEKMPGNHSVVWNGKNDNGESVPAQVYIYKLRTNSGYIFNKRILKL